MIAEGYPFLVEDTGYRCGQECYDRHLGNTFVNAYRDGDGTRWARYSCNWCHKLWETTVTIQVYEELTGSRDG